MHVVSREEMRNIDQYTITHIGLGGPVLMENAGRAVYAALEPECKAGDRICVVIGKGNNGGDGFVIARMLFDSGAKVSTWLAADPQKISGEAADHMRAYCACGGTLLRISDAPETFQQQLDRADWIIDALLGTGIHGAPYPDDQQVIRWINASKGTVISVDLPSGVPANGEAFDHPAVLADQTMTLECPKLAQFMQPAARHFGTVRVLPIGIPNKAYQQVGVQRELRMRSDVVRTLPVRDPFSHKGNHGKGLLIAGSKNMPGAAFFSAKAALRSGIGLLKVSVPEAIQPILAAQLPETMYLPRVQVGLDGASGVGIGPGLGREAREEELVCRLVEESDTIPCVIDADGLFHLRNHLDLLPKRHKPAVLSPHPGEMALLTHASVQDVERDRFGISKAFAEKYQVYLVLKGKATLVTAPDGRQIVNPTGNAAMAKGGSGDVLTGILLAFLLQHEQMMDAVSNAVYVHGAAAEELAAREHSLLDVLASDLIEAIPPVLHQLYDEKTCR
ncbi:bifunctional ADP-dependent NAD(P)H-hydrate dehydratase/NAD(P)H-hydrate epimerase [Sporolactobacillus terrae]|uniref:bifunctional ADP-dependent NAD(P)H-hydrate dehydratase/NAD(P)H-hydrate epimerase n=1 Tax=Sporolactobacillus terrae TaxID=269673 RepID=UPI00048BFBDF|nr:bifunctional ADP-dependent NAD(P)H-hydrate dehydratase/NAD(P)H-hydrate epimerase [Sporolactobacillus terrae]